MGREQEIADALARLVGAIGTPDFPACFHAALRALADVQLCSAFLIGGEPPVRLLFAEGDHPAITGFPLRASLDYARSFWRSDHQIVRLARSGAKRPIVVRRSAAEIADPAWRDACYDRPGVAERVSIVRSGTPTLVANGYRLGQAPAFDPAGIERLERHAALLLATVERHQHVGAAPAPMFSESELVQSLMALRCGLSTREAEVSAAMMLGETQEEIASRKGLSRGSVVTYRRRAYGKLGIANRRGLLRLHRRLLTGDAPLNGAGDGGTTNDGERDRAWR